MEINVGELIVRDRHTSSDGITPANRVDWGRPRPVLIHVKSDPIKEVQIHPGRQTWAGLGQQWRWSPTSIDLHTQGEDCVSSKREIEETSTSRPLTKRLLTELSQVICDRLGIEYFDVGAYYKKGFTIYVEV
jgi:hypothetical protein